MDAVSDGRDVVIGGVMQHIEDAGIHSGDSACVLPPYLISESDIETMKQHTISLAKALGVVGLINVQYAIKDGTVYVLEVNPRGSRTIPFVSKAIGVPLASVAARLMLGETLEQVGFTREIVPPLRVGQGSGLPVHEISVSSIRCWAQKCDRPVK